MLRIKSIANSAGHSRAKVLAITSIGGGEGKTFITTNLGIELAKDGIKVCIVDAGFGAVNAHFLLNIWPVHTLQHLIKGETQLADILIDSGHGVSILPGDKSILQHAILDPDQQQRLLFAILELKSRFDYLLIDCPSRMSDVAQTLLQLAEAVILVITPESAPVSEVSPLFKLWDQEKLNAPELVVLNKLQRGDDGEERFGRFRAGCCRRIADNLELLAEIKLDENVPISISMGAPLILANPLAPANAGLSVLANRLRQLFAEQESALATATPDVSAGEMAGGSRASKHAAPPAAQPKPEWAVTRLVAALRDETVERSLCISWINQLLRAYWQRFDAFPFDPAKLLYRRLLRESEPNKEIGKVLVSLESLHRKLCGGSLYAFDGMPMQQLLESLPEAEIADLAKRLGSIYRKRFQRELFDGRSALITQIRAPDYSLRQFRDLHQDLLKTFEERFMHPDASAKDAVKELEEGVSGDELHLLMQTWQEMLGDLEPVEADLGIKNQNESPLPLEGAGQLVEPAPVGSSPEVAGQGTQAHPAPLRAGAESRVLRVAAALGGVLLLILAVREYTNSSPPKPAALAVVATPVPQREKAPAPPQSTPAQAAAENAIPVASPVPQRSIADASPAEQPAAVQAATGSAAVASAPEQSPAVEPAPSPPASPEPALDQPASPAPPVAEKIPPATSVTAGDSLSLQVSADCWLEIRDRAGRRLAKELVKGGSTRHYEGRAPFTVLLGNAPAVKLEHNGQPFNLAPYQSHKVARFKLG